MKLTIATILTLFAFLTCKKYSDLEDKQDVGPNYVRGRLFFVNDITGDSIPKAVDKKQVVLANADDTTTNFILSTTTDADGYFLFENIQKNKNYKINFKGIVDNIIYFAEQPINTKSSIDTLAIIARPSEKVQNGYVYTVTDNQNGLVGNAKACAFTSFVLAAPNVCDGANWTDNGNSSGKISHINIPATTYIVIFQGGTTSLPLRARDTINVAPKGILRKRILLQ